jgi:hypothetical protein
MAILLKSDRLRDPANHKQVYGDGIGEEALAWQRARTVADFYRRPVEVCVVAGPVAKSIGEPVEPGPLAPQPTFNEP